MAGIISRHPAFQFPKTDHVSDDRFERRSFHEFVSNGAGAGCPDPVVLPTAGRQREFCLDSPFHRTAPVRASRGNRPALAKAGIWTSDLRCWIRPISRFTGNAMLSPKCVPKIFIPSYGFSEKKFDSGHCRPSGTTL